MNIHLPINALVSPPIGLNFNPAGLALRLGCRIGEYLAKVSRSKVEELCFSKQKTLVNHIDRFSHEFLSYLARREKKYFQNNICIEQS